VWNPADGATVSTPQPKRADGTKVNLFCSGHSFLPDGRLLVVGGHQADGDGLSQACLYDAAANIWTSAAPMTTPAGEVRRWYPTAMTLADGTVLVLSGSFVDPDRPPGAQVVVADLLQIWAGGTWRTIPKDDGTPLNFIGLPLYPRMHVAADGQVFMSGTNDRTLLLKTSTPGQWTEVAFRIMGNRDYCPAVMYDVGKVIYIGGGNNAGTHAPTAETEVIDLGANQPAWQKTSAMAFPRRQHNAVLLPDGTVLVLGGTRGGGGPNNGFDDLTPGQPVHIAELWNPGTGQWTQLAAESVDRCYHATAVLLPDARVLSAGGGEYRPDGVVTNDPEDSHRDAQVFSPPYLFRGPRPVITSAPASVTYGATFDVGTAQPDDIRAVNWIRLPSVTHSFDENQRINFLSFQRAPQKLRVTAPASANVCTPGHYMLFLLGQAGVPSVARIIQIQAQVQPSAERVDAAARADVVPAERPAYLQISSREAAIRATAHGTKVVVGVTGTCPYGIGSCWGGAYEALGRLEGVDLVSPVPDVEDSTAQLFLADDRLPPLQRWNEQFRRIVNGTYEMRGVEVTVRGSIYLADGRYFLTGTDRRPPVQLAPLTGKIQWDHLARSLKPPQEQELRAYDNLIIRYRDTGEPVTVTGPLTQTDGEYHVHVRLLEA
jgi:galactose oxidase